MRRGWMDWAPEEVPQELLHGRVSQVATACRQQDVDALVLYSSYTRPAQVSALTHFVPFWSQACLAVRTDGASMLTMATTGRTVQWIRSSSCVDEVIVGPNAGAVAGKWLSEAQSTRRIAVANLDDMPSSVLAGLRSQLPDAQLVEASGWYEPLAARFDPPPAVSRRAIEIAREGLAQVVSSGVVQACATIGAVEGRCRALGAEEVAVYIAPDLERANTLYRLEGEASLGSRFAVQVTVAYKGCWLRCASTFIRDADGVHEAPECSQLRQVLQEAARAGCPASAVAAQLANEPDVEVEHWELEARTGGLALAPVGGPDFHTAALIPSCATFSAQLRLRGGATLIAEPVAFSPEQG